jgi:hypothetical protein
MAKTLSKEDLHRLATVELLQLFSTLQAPDMREMQGEYRATLLTQPNLLATALGWMAVANPFRRWQCKAFRPVEGETGRGYNTFLQGEQVVQHYPMLTLLAPSRFDGQPAYQLVYRHFESLCGDVNMVDEVRRVVPGLYLGIGTWGFSKGQRHIPLPFLLEGPVAPYLCDIGRIRKNFVIGSRELPALSGA